MRNTTKAADSATERMTAIRPGDVGARREPVRGIDHVSLALTGAGLVAFWCLLAIWWLES